LCCQPPFNIFLQICLSSSAKCSRILRKICPHQLLSIHLNLNSSHKLPKNLKFLWKLLLFDESADIPFIFRSFRSDNLLFQLRSDFFKIRSRFFRFEPVFENNNGQLPQRHEKRNSKPSEIRSSLMWKLPPEKFVWMEIIKTGFRKCGFSSMFSGVCEGFGNRNQISTKFWRHWSVALFWTAGARERIKREEKGDWE
jgi:phage shock protein PspC (stress-responsive transcriptional regulator)